MTATKKQLAQWADLKNRRDRDETGLFLAEGPKVVAEARAAGWAIEAILTSVGDPSHPDHYDLTKDQLQRVSGFRTPPEILAVVRRPLSFVTPGWTPGTLALVLDGVQDPGNVGTLIRTAAWFGFSAVFHTPDSADPFGPKAVQASMGAIFHLKTALVTPEWFDALPAKTPLVGSFLEGASLFEAELPSEGLVVLGSEGRGIGEQLASRVTHRLTIPRSGPGAESLNVAVAAAILLAEFRRPTRRGL